MRWRFVAHLAALLAATSFVAHAQDGAKPGESGEKPAAKPDDGKPAEKEKKPKDGEGAKDEKKDGSKGAEIGKPAPDFSATGSDGKTYKLSDFKDKTLVLEWISKDCPTCKKQGPKLKETATELGKKGVVWLGIDSSYYRKSEDNKKFVADEKIPYPILEDFDGKIGRAFGAKVTPHIFVIHKGKLVYTGALVKVAEERNYVKDAVEAVLADKEPPLQTTPPYG